MLVTLSFPEVLAGREGIIRMVEAAPVVLVLVLPPTVQTDQLFGQLTMLLNRLKEAVLAVEVVMRMV